MSEYNELFDTSLLQRRKNRAAADIDQHDFLLARSAEDLADRTALMRREFALALNIGAWHGLLSQKLGDLPNVGQVISGESASALLARCPAPRLRCDPETVPVAASSVDMVASCLSLHLVNDLPGALVQLRRILRPDGLFITSVLGGLSLHELRTSLLQAEEETLGGASPRVIPFADVRSFGSLLQRAGLALPVTDSDIVTVTYETPLKLLADLRGMGCSNMLTKRRKTPLRRSTLLRAMEIYSDTFGLPGGRVPATFEIVTLTAWAPHDKQQKPLKPGSAKMRLAEALGTEEFGTGEMATPPPSGRPPKKE